MARRTSVLPVLISLVFHGLILAAVMFWSVERPEESPSLSLQVSFRSESPPELREEKEPQEVATPELEEIVPEAQQEEAPHEVAAAPSVETPPEIVTTAAERGASVETSSRPPSDTAPLPWEIDTPPRMLRPGNFPQELPVNAMLDCMPLSASIHLDEAGKVFLVLYEPQPSEEARACFNAFIASAEFAPGYVGDLPAPAILVLPFSVEPPDA